MTKSKNTISKQQAKKWFKFGLSGVLMACLFECTDSLGAFVISAISWVVLTVIGFKENRKVMKWLFICSVILSVLALVVTSVTAIKFNDMTSLVSAVDVSTYWVFSSLFWWVTLCALHYSETTRKKGE